MSIKSLIMDEEEAEQLLDDLVLGMVSLHDRGAKVWGVERIKKVKAFKEVTEEL